MSICECYKVKNQYIKSNEIQSHGQVEEQVIKIPYCTHEESPATLKQISGFGGANLLQCESDLQKCQIART